MGLGLKDKQDLDPWRLGLRGHREGPSREGSSVNKGVMEKIQGQPGGWERRWEVLFMMSALDQHFLFHCCNNCRTVFLLMITDETEVQRALMAQFLSSRAEIHTWFWLRNKVPYYVNPKVNLPLLSKSSTRQPEMTQMTPSARGGEQKPARCESSVARMPDSLVRFCHCFIWSSFSWVFMASLYPPCFPPLGSAPSSLLISPVICAAQLDPSDSPVLLSSFLFVFSFPTAHLSGLPFLWFLQSPVSHPGELIFEDGDMEE